jgi:hypothetical protein
MFRRCFERRYEDSCRVGAALSASRHGGLPDRRLARGLRINLASIAVEKLTEVRIEALGLGLNIFGRFAD